MSSGKKQTQTTNQKTKSRQNTQTIQTPYKPAVSRLNTALTKSDALLDQGGPAVYAGDRVADFTPDQLTGFDRTRTVADQLSTQAPNPGIGALGAMINAGGLTGRQNEALEALRPIATGDPLNPYLRGLIDDQAGELTDQLNRAYAGAGRLGSYSNANAIGDAVGDYMRGALFQGYDLGMGHKMGAADRIVSGDQAGQGNVLTAAGLLPNLQAADANARLLGANLYGNVGREQQGQAQSETNAAISAFNEREARPYANLQYYLSNVLPIAQAGGTTKAKGTASSDMSGTTETVQKTPAWQTALGAGLSVASLFGGGGPFAGALGGLFGSSGGSAPSASPSYLPYMTPYGGGLFGPSIVGGY